MECLYPCLGLLLSIIGLILLIVKPINEESLLRLINFSIFGASLIILNTASTLFHNSKDPKRRRQLNIVDHVSIYILIAGSYTPFGLITLKGSLGWVIFGIVWTIAIIGIVLKLFYTGSFEKASTIAYVFMGFLQEVFHILLERYYIVFNKSNTIMQFFMFLF